MRPQRSRDHWGQIRARAGWFERRGPGPLPHLCAWGLPCTVLRSCFPPKYRLTDPVPDSIVMLKEILYPQDACPGHEATAAQPLLEEPSGQRQRFRGWLGTEKPGL